MAHLFGERRIFEIAQSRAAEFVVLMRRRRHEHVPQPFGARLLLQIFQNGDHLPALALGVLLLVDRNRGPHMLVHERLHPIEPFALTVRHIEVHGTLLATVLRSLAALFARRSFAARFLSSRRDSGGGAVRIDTTGLQTIVSYNCLKCNAPPHRAMRWRRIIPEARSLPPPSGYTPTAVSATSRCATSLLRPTSISRR